MKLYMHPASTASRPILLWKSQNAIDIEEQIIDLFTSEHHGDAYKKINPNCLVPALADGDLILTESSAILKYLAESFATPDFPKGLKARARINERIDWFNANLYKDLGYNLVYPQLFPHHRRPTDAAQDGTLAWGLERTRHWLGILDKHLLGDQPYLCGDSLTIADYFGACLIELGKAIGNDYSAYLRIEAWMARMRELPGWNDVHDAFYGFVASLEGKKFIAV